MPPLSLGCSVYKRDLLPASTKTEDAEKCLLPCQTSEIWLATSNSPASNMYEFVQFGDRHRYLSNKFLNATNHSLRVGTSQIHQVPILGQVPPPAKTLGCALSVWHPCKWFNQVVMRTRLVQFATRLTDVLFCAIRSASAFVRLVPSLEVQFGRLEFV